MSHFHLTIKDALKKDVFKNAHVLAGAAGLDKPIKWTHIIEIKKFDSLLNGGELILTTGMNLELESSLSAYESFIHKNVSGICIEIGPYFQNLSPEIKAFADKHRFPIIVFEKTVKFVDITQELHTCIINQHYQMLHTLNNLNKTFTELSLLPNGIVKILETLYNHFQHTALFISNDDKSHYYPPEAKVVEKLLSSELKNELPNQYVIACNNMHFALSPVHLLGQVWGHLCIQTDEKVENEFLFSVLDRAATSIAQVLLRNRTMEERKLNKEDDLVQRLLLGKPYNTDELKSILPSVDNQQIYYRIFINHTKNLSFKNEKEWNEIKVQKSMAIRSLFKRHGFTPAISVRKSETAVICFFHARQYSKPDMDRLTGLNNDFFKAEESYIGISGKHVEITNLPRAYKEAKEVLRFNKLNNSATLFYEKIGVHRLLFQLQDSHLVETFIDDYIGPLIQYDHDMKTELLKTLELYLKFNESKKETAERLYIVRQTLYHRLDKIEELLGKTFLEPTNRLAIEVAIQAYYSIKNVSLLNLIV